MASFRTPRGFEEGAAAPLWRRFGPGVTLDPLRADPARLAAIAARTPEVFARFGGRPRTAQALGAHLGYITRGGALDLEDQDGCRLRGLADLKALRDDWVAAARFDSQSRANSPVAHALTLSFVAMPQSERLDRAVRDVLQGELGGRFDYVFVRHDDTALPHAHVSIRSQGLDGARFHPTPQDLSRWREGFAEALRRQGLAAEATPRWVRGAGRRSEPYYLFKIRQAWLEGGPVEPRIWRQAHRDAARLLARAEPEPRPWETQMRSRQARVAKAYGEWAQELLAEGTPESRRLGEALVGFVAGLRAPESLRQSLARDLEGAWLARQRTAERERER